MCMTRRFIMILLSSSFFMSLAEASAQAKTEKEINCLALNIYYEARGEPLNGQFAVAAVTMNRVKSYKYPNTVCGVVWQRRQFSWTHDGKSDRPTEKRAWHKAQSLAKLVYSKYLSFQAKNNGAWDITLGALHYYSSSIDTPYWAKEKDVSARIGRHKFVLM